MVKCTQIHKHTPSSWFSIVWVPNLIRKLTTLLLQGAVTVPLEQEDAGVWLDAVSELRLWLDTVGDYLPIMKVARSNLCQSTLSLSLSFTQNFSPFLPHAPHLHLRQKHLMPFYRKIIILSKPTLYEILKQKDLPMNNQLSRNLFQHFLNFLTYLHSLYLFNILISGGKHANVNLFLVLSTVWRNEYEMMRKGNIS